MLVPIKWLSDYVDVNIDIDELSDQMIMSGSMVESVDKLYEDINGVVVGKILNIEKHPDADKLVVCKVDIGYDKLQIVTGAPNINEGDFVPVAVHGSTLPGGVKIKKGKLRGIVSEGMMCSGEELGLAEADYEGASVYGIMILKEEYSLGIDIKEALELNDTVIEFEITSNRPDCLSMIGIARECSVVTGENLKLPQIKVEGCIDDVNKMASVIIEDFSLCPRYCARIVKDIKIEQSPQWMKRRLAAAGVRPINNIVDITNYVMLETGQPMHAFDYDKIAGNSIVVRNAKKGEELVTLDDNPRKLTEDTIVISDKDKPIALAGVMGGANSEVSEDTKTILFESAMFNAGSVRTTAKRLNLRSEASSRFEKGIDYTNVSVAINRAVQLIQELDAGTVVEGIIDVNDNSYKPSVIEADYNKINNLLGLNLTCEQIVDILKSLEFEIVVDGSMLRVNVPSFRLDIEGYADLAEEVARIYGYNKIPSTMISGEISSAVRTREQNTTDRIEDLLTGMGLYQVSTYSFTSPDILSSIGIEDSIDVVKIANPLGEDQSVMRTTLVPSMLEVLSRNINRSIDQCSIFEIGATFKPLSLPLDKLPQESKTLAIASYGGDNDFYTVKGWIETLLSELGIDDVDFIPCQKSPFHPGRAASILIDKNEVGTIGEIHPKVMENYEISSRAYTSEIDLSLILAARVERSFKALPKHPAVTRDLAIIVNKRVLAGDIEKAIKKAGGKLLEDVELFDIYEGGQIPNDCKSLAFSLSYRSYERTLKDKEVKKQHEKIINKLSTEFNASLR